MSQMRHIRLIGRARYCRLAVVVGYDLWYPAKFLVFLAGPACVVPAQGILAVLPY